MDRRSPAFWGDPGKRIGWAVLVGLCLLATGCPDQDERRAQDSLVLAETADGGDAPDVARTDQEVLQDISARTEIETSQPPAAILPMIDEQGVALAPNDLGATLHLLPRVRLDGQWHGGGLDGPCRLESAQVVCPAGPAGNVAVELSRDTAVVQWHADQAATVEALSLEGRATVADANAWHSDGFHSWSQSGILALGAPPNATALDNALASRGNPEVARLGREFSWWFSYVGGGGPVMVAGVTSAQRFKSWVQFYLDGQPDLAVRLVNGAAGEMVSVAAAETLAGEPWYLAAGSQVQPLLEAYADHLESRRATVVRPAEAGWNSWYEYWDQVDDPAVRANAALAHDILAPRLPATAPPLRIVIDDGWQQAWGEWWPNDKFPEGLDGLAAALKADGFEMGVWLAPLLVSHESQLWVDHPDWFVADAQYDHPTDGPMAILDVTNPAAAEHLAQTIARIVSWGYGLLKIDFLFAGTFEGTRHQAVTGIQAFNLALQTIREAAGPETTLVAVGAPGIPSFPYVDAWRLGGDIAVEPLGPAWPFVVSEARSVASRWPFCRVTLCDADPPLLRDLPRSEVEAGAWTVAFAGGALFLSDDLTRLPAERPDWALLPDVLAAALSGAPSIPQDLFPAEPPLQLVNAYVDPLSPLNQVVATRWQSPSGRLIAFNGSDQDIVVAGQTIPPHSTAWLPSSSDPAEEQDP